MPKISKKMISAGTRDTIKDGFEVEIHYNQKELFFIKVPPSFNGIVDAMSDTELKKFHAYKVNVSPRGRGIHQLQEWHRAVNAPSEKEVTTRMSEFITYLMAAKTIKRDVIIVYFEEKATHFSGRDHNPKHPAIGMQYGLFYGIETKIGNDGKPVYHNHNNGPNNGLWGEHGYIVIDDSPENRLFVENIYTALASLIEKLEQHTGSPKALLDLIASKQKLIG